MTTDSRIKPTSRLFSPRKPLSLFVALLSFFFFFSRPSLLTTFGTFDFIHCIGVLPERTPCSIDPHFVYGCPYKNKGTGYSLILSACIAVLYPKVNINLNMRFLLPPGRCFKQSQVVAKRERMTSFSSSYMWHITSVCCRSWLSIFPCPL